MIANFLCDSLEQQIICCPHCHAHSSLPNTLMTITLQSIYAHWAIKQPKPQSSPPYFLQSLKTWSLKNFFLAWGRQQLEAELKTLILFAGCHSVYSKKPRVAIPEQRGWIKGRQGWSTLVLWDGQGFLVGKSSALFPEGLKEEETGSCNILEYLCHLAG